MHIFLIGLVAIALLAVGQSEVRADALLDKFGATFPDSAVQETTTLALKNIQSALCEAGKPCAPATAEELKQPPITIEDGRSAMAQGVVSALAQHCGLDWRTRSFSTMTAYRRHDLKMSERAITLMVLMHGMSQGAILEELKRRPCTDQLRAQLDVTLPKR